MNEQMSFNGRSIWVTGAGQGIGRAVAEGFARLGGQVIGFDRTFSEGDYGFTTYLLDVGDADAGLVSFAEHNRTVTSAWKNLFDWMSRIDMKVCGPTMRAGTPHCARRPGF